MTICVDVDGVLTDGKIWVNHQGEIIKSFNNKDLGAIKELLAMFPACQKCKYLPFPRFHLRSTGLPYFV